MSCDRDIDARRSLQFGRGGAFATEINLVGTDRATLTRLPAPRVELPTSPQFVTPLWVMESLRVCHRQNTC